MRNDRFVPLDVDCNDNEMFFLCNPRLYALKKHFLSSIGVFMDNLMSGWFSTRVGGVQ